jgi:hypothetical protein
VIQKQRCIPCGKSKFFSQKFKDPLSLFSPGNSKRKGDWMSIEFSIFEEFQLKIKTKEKKKGCFRLNFIT